MFNLVLKFPVYEMETGNFTVSVLRHVKRQHSDFHLIRNYPEIPVYAANFRIIPFPKLKFCSGKMETLNKSLRKKWTASCRVV